MDGVGGAGAGGAEEGVEVEALVAGMGEGGSGGVGMEPFIGKNSGKGSNSAFTLPHLL